MLVVELRFISSLIFMRINENSLTSPSSQTYLSVSSLRSATLKYAAVGGVRADMKSIGILILLLLVVACEGTDNNMNDKEIEDNIKSFITSDEFKKSVEEQQNRIEDEYNIKEVAEWFGKTGLGEEIERELPHYLRRELGESLFNTGSLKASDLVYIGSFKVMSGGEDHFWRFPWKDDEFYAKVEVGIDGSTIIGWGSEKPPK